MVFSKEVGHFNLLQLLSTGCCFLACLLLQPEICASSSGRGCVWAGCVGGAGYRQSCVGGAVCGRGVREGLCVGGAV